MSYSHVQHVDQLMIFFISVPLFHLLDQESKFETDKKEDNEYIVSYSLKTTDEEEDAKTTFLVMQEWLRWEVPGEEKNASFYGWLRYLLWLEFWNKCALIKYSVITK